MIASEGSSLEGTEASVRRLRNKLGDMYLGIGSRENRDVHLKHLEIK